MKDEWVKVSLDEYNTLLDNWSGPGLRGHVVTICAPELYYTYIDDNENFMKCTWVRKKKLSYYGSPEEYYINKKFHS